MLKSEMQHQYWVTKKVVQRKLGRQEDECVVSSDAELDAKIELFKSIAESCVQLHRVIDFYQERLCILAQEENNLGKFLKEAGKHSATTSKVLINTGKSISYCGQQRMAIRAPLVRLHHEVETFRGRAVSDTKETIVAMERERTEYRAALSWMKSTSAQLDPDSGKGLEKFRKAQNHVRISKTKFDRFTLDCLQKIDLLAAARCNMFSHALVAYQQALLYFFKKTTETFKSASKLLSNEPQYNFCILKELTQAEKSDNQLAEDNANSTVDTDQLLFFQDDFKDEEDPSDKKSDQTAEKLNEVSSLRQTNILDELIIPEIPTNPMKMDDLQSSSIDLLGLSNTELGDFTSTKPPAFMPSQLLLDDFSSFNMFNDTNVSKEELEEKSEFNDEKQNKTKNSILELFNKIPTTSPKTINDKSNIGIDSSMTSPPPKINKEKLTRKDMSAWFQLFSELDPLSNPDAIERKIDGHSKNINSHTA